jgi:hypothetical protein
MGLAGSLDQGLPREAGGGVQNAGRATVHAGMYIHHHRLRGQPGEDVEMTQSAVQASGAGSRVAPRAAASVGFRATLLPVAV